MPSRDHGGQKKIQDEVAHNIDFGSLGAIALRQGKNFVFLLYLYQRGIPPIFFVHYMKNTRSTHKDIEGD